MTDPTARSRNAQETSSDRLEKIHHRWLGEHKRVPRKLWGAGSALGDIEKMAFLLALFLGGLSSLPDSFLWSDVMSTEKPLFIHQIDGLWLATFLILLSLLNGVLLDLALTDQTSGSRPLHPMVRSLRLLAASIPPFGVLVPALWYRLLQDRRSWLERSEDPRSFRPSARFSSSFGGQFQLFLEERITPFGRRLLTSEWIHIWVLISNLILPFAAIFWLSNPVEWTPGRRVTMVAISVVAHLMAFAGTSYFTAGLRRAQTAKWSRLLLTTLPVFWLVPLPMFFVLGLLILNFVPTSQGDDTLVASAHSGRQSVGRLKIWRELKRSLKRQRSSMPLCRRWRLREVDPPAPSGVEQTRLLRLYKGKAAVLFFEAIFLTRALNALRGSMPTATATAQWILEAAALVALVLGVIALALHLAVVISRMVDAENRLRFLDTHPYAFYFGISLLVFFMGILVGEALQRGNGEPIAGIFVVAGTLGMLANLAGMILPIPERIRQPPVEGLLWFFLFSGMSVIGLTMVRVPEEMKAWMAFLEAMAGPYSGLSVLFGGSLVGWLLRPYEARQIINPGISGRRRLLLAVLTLTAVAPLGGLFVPLWIYIRHRRWPEVSTGTGQE